MSKGRVFFNPIDGSAPLSIYWHTGPKGDAIEAKKGDGVGFFSSSGDLLGVIFDDVNEKKDHQALFFDRYCVEVTTRDGKVSYAMSPIESKKKSPHKSNPKKAVA